MSAIFSPCGQYRYRLGRSIVTNRPGLTIAWLMVNPSTAGVEINDASIRKVCGFSERFGARRVIVGNKFAYKATDIHELKGVLDPVGPDNDRHIGAIIAQADVVVAAWGRLSKLPPELRNRWRKVTKIANKAGCELMCLGTTQDGHPVHPLMISYDTPIIRWKLPHG